MPAGAQLRLPTMGVATFSVAAAMLAEWGCAVVAADARGTRAHWQVDWKRPSALNAHTIVSLREQSQLAQSAASTSAQRAESLTLTSRRIHSRNACARTHTLRRASTLTQVIACAKACPHAWEHTRFLPWSVHCPSKRDCFAQHARLPLVEGTCALICKRGQ
eukprot:6210216-Pleurochrysis_carterae.AAC.1